MAYFQGRTVSRKIFWPGWLNGFVLFRKEMIGIGMLLEGMFAGEMS